MKQTKIHKIQTDDWFLFQYISKEKFQKQQDVNGLW